MQGVICCIRSWSFSIWNPNDGVRQLITSTVPAAIDRGTKYIKIR